MAITNTSIPGGGGNRMHPQDPLSNSGYEFKSLTFPPELGSKGNDDYMVFFINQVTNSKYTSGSQESIPIDIAEQTPNRPNIPVFAPNTINELVSKATDGKSQFDFNKTAIEGTARTSASIALPMPDGYTTADSVTWSSVGNPLSKFGSANSKENMVKDIAKDIGWGELAAAIATVLPGNEVNGDGLKRLGLGLQKQAINPNEEMLFEGVGFRSFDFSFELYPHNESDMNTISNIVKMFRFHSMPEILGNVFGRFFVFPSEFDISCYTGGKENPWLNKISTCALTKISTNYTPQNTWISFKNGGPIGIKLDLSFTELEIMTKRRIYEGY